VKQYLIAGLFVCFVLFVFVSSFESFFESCIIVWLTELLLLRLCVCYGVLLFGVQSLLMRAAVY
jgi:hypothetical protein